MTGTGAARVPKQVREIMRWSAQQIFPVYEQLVAGWATTLCIEIDGIGTVLFCHATPHDDNEIFTRLTPEESLLPIFEALDVDMVVCEHTHMQFDRMIGKIRVVNAGSVGMPFGEPGADWLMLDGEVQLQHTTYDLTKAAERIRKTMYPQAQEFAANHVLQPPGEKQMLEAFVEFRREVVRRRSGVPGAPRWWPGVRHRAVLLGLHAGGPRGMNRNPWCAPATAGTNPVLPESAGPSYTPHLMTRPTGMPGRCSCPRRA